MMWLNVLRTLLSTETTRVWYSVVSEVFPTVRDSLSNWINQRRVLDFQIYGTFQGGVLNSWFVEIVTQQTLTLIKIFYKKNVTNHNLFSARNSNFYCINLLIIFRGVNILLAYQLSYILIYLNKVSANLKIIIKSHNYNKEVKIKGTTLFIAKGLRWSWLINNT